MSHNPVVTLVDNNGLPISSTPNGDGTATLSTTGGGGGGGPSTAVKLVDAAGTNQATIDATGAVKISEPVATTVPVALTGANQPIAATPKDYRGFTCRETAGAAALVVLWDNASAASGTILEQIALAPNESAREYYADGGVKTTAGIYAQVVSGAVAGSVRTGA